MSSSESSETPLWLWIFGAVSLGVVALLVRQRLQQSTKSDNDDDDSDDDESSEVSSTSPAVQLRSLSPKRHSEWTLPQTKTDTNAKIADIFWKPLEAIFIDLPRLAKRIELFDDDQPVSLGLRDDATPLQVLARVIALVAARTETAAQAQRIADAAASALNDASSSGVPHLLVKDVFADPIGAESKCALVFRGIHQGIVMPTSFVIKAHTRLLAKDVKDASGWRVTINFAKSGRITVTHTRREKSFGDAPQDDFLIESNIALTLLESDLIGVRTSFGVVPRVPAQIDGAVDAEFRLLSAWNRA
jgi:hypothetical protein